MYDRVDPGVPVPGVCVSSLNIRRFVSLWLSRAFVSTIVYTCPVTAPSPRRAGRTGRRTSPPAGRAAGWSSVRGPNRRRGCVRLRTRGGGARPPTAPPNARRPGATNESGAPRGRAVPLPGPGARSSGHVTGLTACASRAIAPERETRDIVGSSTKYAVRRFDNRHVQTNRHRGST
jgi:hypothetical protein